ncbi:MAG: hypothetical protein QF441_02780 [Bacteriovoracaceae bacterium]|jgi:hypothetical protein|nr:hypothetical protein [Halobacteriovoraceae bacterium]MDP7319500.1 hypothetical protein [Bacteriovoracaceae bacterium]
MKKLLVAIMALSTASAFAGTDNMVRFYGWDGGDRTKSFDVSMTSDDADEAGKSQNIALNYARAFGQWQVGITYRTVSGATTGTANSDTDGTTTGLSGYYNLESDLGNTCYFALHYNMHSTSDGGYDFDGGHKSLGEDDTATSIVLEYGHRWTVGSAWGMNLAYAPNVTYTMTSYDWDADASEDANGKSYTALGWNFLKFDVMF